jgi:hypothetical protein
MTFALACLLIACLPTAQATCTKDTWQYQCYTPSLANETIASIAETFEIHELKLCDWNRNELLACDGYVPLDFHLKVPHQTCQPRPGQWSCYSARPGDTLKSIAFSKKSVFRSEAAMIKHNKDIMWGQSQVTPGVKLRMPVPRCIPAECAAGRHCLKTCHIVQAGDVLADLLSIYQMTTAEIMDDDFNADVLGGVEKIVTGMSLQVKHPCPLPPQTDPSEWSPLIRKYWDSVVVVPGDDVYKLAQKFKLDYNVICEQNNLDCSTFKVIIEVGKVLKVPKGGCTPVEGQVDCFDWSNGFPDPGDKNPSTWLGCDLKGTNGGGCGAAKSRCRGECKISSVYKSSYYPIPANLSNPLVLEYAKGVFNLNSVQLASTQYECAMCFQGCTNCTFPGETECCPGGYPACLAENCKKYNCSSYENVLQEKQTDQSCMAYALSEIAVPVIPCISDMTFYCQSDLPPGHYLNPAMCTIFGDPTMSDTHGSPNGLRTDFNILDQSCEQWATLLPGTNGEFNFTAAERVPGSTNSSNFCENSPGPNGQHCFKLGYGDSKISPDKFESLWTTAVETGEPWQTLCAKYSLTNCSFINSFVALGIDNSAGPVPPIGLDVCCYDAGSTSVGGYYTTCIDGCKGRNTTHCPYTKCHPCSGGKPCPSVTPTPPTPPTPAAPTPAPPIPAPTPAPPGPAPTPAPGGCPGCIGGSHGVCKAPSNVCFPASAGVCPAGTTHC